MQYHDFLYFLAPTLPLSTSCDSINDIVELTELAVNVIEKLKVDVLRLQFHIVKY